MRANTPFNPAHTITVHSAWRAPAGTPVAAVPTPKGAHHSAAGGKWAVLAAHHGQTYAQYMATCAGLSATMRANMGAVGAALAPYMAASGAARRTCNYGAAYMGAAVQALAGTMYGAHALVANGACTAWQLFVAAHAGTAGGLGSGEALYCQARGYVAIAAPAATLPAGTAATLPAGTAGPPMPAALAKATAKARRKAS